MSSEQVACKRCRAQKLRCDRQHPRCARCLRVDAECSFPAPPDRKLIAAQRRPPRTAHKRQRRTKTESNHGITDLDSQTLVSTYFANVFKAGLIHHRPTFEKRLQDNDLPQHAVLAVYALALTFLHHETPYNRQARLQLQHIGDFYNLAEEYATTAGKEVLITIDEPSMDSLQTCHDLGYFWFSRGDTYKNATFSGLGYRGARARLMDYQVSSWLEGEQVRRCFWVGWLQTCVNSDDYVVGSASDGLALNTALPVSEASYLAELEEDPLTLAQMLERKPGHQESHLSIWASFLTGLAWWTKIRDHIAARRTSTADKILYDTLDIQRDFDNCIGSMHSSLVYSKRNLCEKVVYKQEVLFTTIHALIHQTRLVLHSSLVPRFQGTAPPGLPIEAIKGSTEAAIRSAQSLTDLACDLISLNCDLSILPPYVGYGMYVAGSIHLTMINSAILGKNARRQLNLALTVLQTMKPFFMILQRLWTRLLAMCEVQVVQGSLSMDSFMPASDTAGTDLSQPIPAYSLSKLKHEVSDVDAASILHKISPNPEGIQSEDIISAPQPQPLGELFTADTTQISLEDFNNTQISFDDLANTYGDDWWQLNINPLSMSILSDLEVPGFV